MAKILLNFRAGFDGLREGFGALGHEVLENQWQPSAAQLRDAVLCVADFVDCARRLRRTVALRRRLAAAGVPFVALNRDAPFNRGVHPSRLALLGWLKPFDGYASHSMQDAARFGQRTTYCPNAARESHFHATAESLAVMRDPASYQWDVSFFGNLDAVRYREHARRAEFLHVLRSRLEQAGTKVLFRDGAGLSQAEQLELITRSRINLSVMAGCDAGAQMSWGLPERCYGVPGCGGFLLSDRRRHALDDFAPDEWADFEGLDECEAQIRRFLERFDLARGIAERAQARVARDHGYKQRAERLLDFARHAG
jgi:spore maturation protein CgeB